MVAIVCCLLALWPVTCQAQEADLAQALEQMDLSGWDAAAGTLMGDTTAKGVVQRIAAGQMELDAGAILYQLGDALGRAFAGQRARLAALCTMLCVCAVLARVQQHLDGQVSAFARLAVTALCVGMPVALAGDAIGVSFAAARHLGDFAGVALPAIGALGTALGATGSVAMLSPLAAGAASLASVLAGQAGRPVLCVLAALAVVEPFGSDMAIGKVFDSVRALSGFALTAVVAVFACVVLVQGNQSVHADSVALRGVKYAVDNYVPVVGGLFADTFDLMASSVWVLKNAVGLAAMLYLCALALQPLLALTVSFLVLKAGALFAYLVGETAAGTLLERFAQVIALTAALTATCAALYLTVMAAACVCTGQTALLG